MDLIGVMQKDVEERGAVVHATSGDVEGDELAVSFKKLTVGKPHYEVARKFAAMLHLVCHACLMLCNISCLQCVCGRCSFCFSPTCSFLLSNSI